MQTAAKAAALLIAIATGLSCTHAGGKLMVDVPKMLPYQAPDIDDITGIDSDDEPAESATSGSAQKPHK